MEKLSRMCNLALVPPGKISSPEGEIHEVTDWSGFCDKHGLEKYNIWKVLTGRATVHYQWTLPGTLKKNHPNEKQYTLYHKSGSRHDFTGLSEFCRKNGLKKAGIQALIVGRNRVSQGFARCMADFGSRMLTHQVTLIKDGKEVVLKSIKSAQSAIGINHAYVRRLIRGELQSHHGWTIKSVEKLPLYP